MGLCAYFPTASAPHAGTPPSVLWGVWSTSPTGQIAAVAAVHDATVVTGNVSHFEAFEGLRVENWLA